ncbi:MAG: GNAT family N-acetyltransferase [Thermomicrobiales bacterium]|nr:GNAT family N-acetyltransferase [Thermomicrobiales bacterium]
MNEGQQRALQDFHDNQCLWLARLATGAPQPQLPHPHLFAEHDTLAIRTGESGIIMLPYTASPDHASLDASLSWARQHAVNDLLIWNMQPDHALDLELLARGFRVGFEPWWMTRDLDAPIPAPTHDVTLATDSDIEQLRASQIPYIVPTQLDSTRELVRQASSGEVVWLVARDGDTVNGQAIVNLDGDHAGLFNVGVDGRHRHRGVGSSLTAAAMQMARDRGARTMNLNSTPMGEHLYLRAGFIRIGNGMTWSASGMRARSAVNHHVHDLAIAIGDGDVASVTRRNVRHHLPNGMTAQELAARFGQRDMLLHLVSLGQVPEIISLWEVGLRDEAVAATSDPRARELTSGPRQARPLHLAVERGAGTLVLALIHAGADVNARDSEFRATPLDWAHACDKPTIARIIRQAGGE